MSSLRISAYIFTAISSLALCFGGALVYERWNAENDVRHYILIWEQDLVQTLVHEKDKKLLEKIVPQLELVNSSIESAKASLLSDTFQFSVSDRLDQFQVPLAMNYVTIGMVEVRLNLQRMLLAALGSPLFLISLFLLTSFTVLLLYKEQKVRFERRSLEEKLHFQSEIAQMARKVAHDIRSPLGALRIIAGKEDAVLDSYKSLFSQAAERIHQIAEELLTFSRSSSSQEVLSGRVVAKNDNFSLEAMTNTLAQEFSLKAPQILWNFEMQNATGLASQALAMNGSRVLRILENILQNSVEADAKSVHVQIVGRGRDIVFSIKDDGKGIPDEILAKLFKQEISHGKRNGNGLGLKSAKEEVEKVGGKLNLVSRIQQGTLIQLQIPVQ